MSNPYAPSSRGWSSSGSDDDGWGPSTSVRSGQAARPNGSSRGNGAWGPTTNRAAGETANGQSNGRFGGAVAEPRGARDNARSNGRDNDGWAVAGPLSARDQRATRKADRDMERQAERARHPRELTAAARAHERGLPWWAALIVLVIVAAIGGVIDTIGAIQVKGGFNIGIVVASVLAVLIVRRAHMFPIVIAPPIVYSLAAVFQLYLRSNGLHDKKVVFDAAANYLVYGFPAIAAATAAVLIIAGFRLISRK